MQVGKQARQWQVSLDVQVPRCLAPWLPSTSLVLHLSPSSMALGESRLAAFQRGKSRNEAPQSHHDINTPPGTMP